MNYKPKKGTCQLLGPVSLIIQCLMGLLVVMVLLLKRNYEHPRRKLIVWAYDISKQMIGSLVIHFLNLGISVWKRRSSSVRFLFHMAGAGDDGDDGDDGEQCDWYFVNLLMDTTLGIPILWVTLHYIEKLAHMCNITNVESGNYFEEHHTLEPELDLDSNECTGWCGSFHMQGKIPLFSAFCKQLVVFILGLVGMKFVIFLVLNYFEDMAYWFANLVLGWSDPWPNFQVFLVMFVSPVLLNCFQYCCIDNIIKLHHLNKENLDNFESKDNVAMLVGDVEESETDERSAPACSSNESSVYNSLLGVKGKPQRDGRSSYGSNG
ncbi:uncharacterized protein KNAG_0J01770 [Huiozyma naganishii CBS 8797]|uniref:Vacuolar membrane protein n=1 Tax=Huiozyma naganishii (strain ATCC MYA-139 / BCRC 22969 / CBS 8797 / KCTC 17520 / NBRC 10181 / NCYC 3082 / Yp74L-3) TaxID=1071383 RepID=J7RR00_HUIN7|nr:hypothetical protein KNAG_0J01770 [Kazachstania naganishii CBS 8797]CCK72258.1 hypothetical protein KNAG_0J01770 [Kazachstania naganishii CBS 8797]